MLSNIFAQRFQTPIQQQVAHPMYPQQLSFGLPAPAPFIPPSSSGAPLNGGSGSGTLPGAIIRATSVMGGMQSFGGFGGQAQAPIQPPMPAQPQMPFYQRFSGQTQQGPTRNAFAQRMMQSA